MPNDKVQMDRLVETHRTYAHAIAAEIAKKLPPHVERTELQSAAELGLVEAAAGFDGRPGVQFKTFAYYRIRGAVYDSIRKATWFSSKQYSQYVAAAGANEYFADQTTAETSGPATLAELDRHVGAVVACFMLSLESGKAPVPADQRRSAEEHLLADERESRLQAALEQLPERNRTIIKACYYQNRTLDDVGREMGLSKSWACRLHARGIEMLRDLMTQAPRKAAAAVPVERNSRSVGAITPGR
jgi:RNA polymerase sigma factor FliA